LNNVICQCVVVLYRSTFEQSKTLRSLMAVKESYPALCAKMGLLIYDNSPKEQRQTFDGSGFGSFAYLHDPQNSGLAVAYNAGLSRAQTSGIDWLMLLDQDTELHHDSLHALFNAIESRPPDSICALVPKLLRGDTVLSPQRIGRFKNQSVTPDFAGISVERLTALNSAACLRIRALVEIGGFPQEYWLDFLDHAVFHRLQAAGGKVQVLDTVIQHQLSSLNLEHEMSLSRYTGMLAAEWRFVRETGTGGGAFCHRLRLLKRTVTYAVRWKNKAYARETLRASLA
jgi:GT2 family glycosyltransferase